jgi:hypothetical protein
VSSPERERWKRYDGYARRVINCTDPECTPEDHIRNLRFLMLSIYDDGQRDALSGNPRGARVRFPAQEASE